MLCSEISSQCFKAWHLALPLCSCLWRHMTVFLFLGFYPFSLHINPSLLYLGQALITSSWPFTKLGYLQISCLTILSLWKEGSCSDSSHCLAFRSAYGSFPYRYRCDKWPERPFWARRKEHNRTTWKHHKDFVVMETEFCIFKVAEKTAKLFTKDISFVSWP